MQNFNEGDVTQAVIDRHDNPIAAKNPRLQALMTSVITHLHAFAREVELTEEEWEHGVKFLTDVGQMCSQSRQEFILLSDVLGLSSLFVAQNNRKPAGCTEATVFGPFYVPDTPQLALGANISEGLKGTPCFVNGTVTDVTTGEPIPNVKIEVWHSDADGSYDVQKEGMGVAGRFEGRAVFASDERGRFHFETIAPEAYPVPHDGPVGKMLQALGRHPWRPAH